MKQCRVCNETKPLDDFYIKRTNKDGFQTECKTCHNKMVMDWRKKNPHRSWAQSVIHNHKYRNFEVKISIEELEALIAPALDNGCFYCGEEMAINIDSGHIKPNSATLDTIDSSKRSLEHGNIRIICNSCNAGKSTLSEKEYIRKCKKVAKRFNEDGNKKRDCKTKS